MEEFSQYLISYGPLGLFIASFLAATIAPFSSEIVLVALLQSGVGETQLFFYATAGNSLGSLFTYGIGRLGKLKWAQKYLKIHKDDFIRFKISIRKYGGFFGFLCWLPIIGDPLALALGYFRASFLSFGLSMTVGKAMRYGVLIWVFRP